jgi:hypothetical protein
MEKINDLFDVQIAKTIDAYPSIFSKDDVITLLSSLRTDSLHAIHEMLPQPSAYLIDEEKFQEFNAAVRSSLDNFLDGTNNEVIDYDSAEFNISYDNRLELENICLNNDTILEELDDILLTKWQEFYGDLKTDE